MFRRTLKILQYLHPTLDSENENSVLSLLWINPLSANRQLCKMVKHTQTILRLTAEELFENI